MIRFLFVLALLATSATADVVIVDSAGSGDYTGIQLAIDNSADGDVILVKAGSYSGFQVTNRTLGILAFDSDARPVISDPVSVLSVGAAQSVLLSGLEIEAMSGTGRALFLGGCDGAVRVQDCLLNGASPAIGTGAIRILNSHNVALAQCDVRAGIGGYGLSIFGSEAASAQSVFAGGSPSTCVDGGSGVQLSSGSFLFDSASLFVGTDGSPNACPCNYYACGTSGGNAVEIGLSPAPSELQLSGTVLIRGLGGWGLCSVFSTCDGANGTTYLPAPNPPPITISGTERRSRFSATAVEGGTLEVLVEGVVGDQAVLVLSQQPLFDANTGNVGVQLVGPPVLDPAIYREFSLGTLAVASETATVYVPAEAASFEHATWFAQVVTTDVNGDSWYGPGRTLTILDNPDLGVDLSFCNGDGGDQAGCTNCPCSNNTVAGTIGGCLNSAATSSRLIATGSLSISLPDGSDDDLRFALTGAPPTAFCTLNSGSALAPTGMANPCFGMGSGAQSLHFDGLRCAVTGTRRHGGRSADTNGNIGEVTAAWGGEANPNKGVGRAAGFVAGQTRYFQVINREDPLLSCMRGLATSQAIEITFQP